MTDCPACGETAFDDGLCSVCGHEQPPVYELDMDALDDAPVPLSLDALTPLAPESADTDGGIEALPLDALEDLGPMELESSETEEPIPMMEGLEGTMIEETRRRPKKEERKPFKEKKPFVHTKCPQCEADVPQPNPPFCEQCGFKLVMKKSGPGKSEAPGKVCGECGSKNSADAGMCRNCGSRLKSLED